MARRRASQPMVRGWLLDAYADYDADSIVLWLWTPRGPRRVVDRGYRVPFFVSGSQEGLRNLGQTLEGLQEVADWAWGERRTDLRSEELHEVLEVQPRHYGEVKPLAELIDDSGGHYDYRLYNVDLRLNQRYLHDRGIFPSSWVECNGRWKALEEQFVLEYKVPPVGIEVLDLHVENPLGIHRFQDKFLGFRLGEVAMEGGSEVELMEGLMAAAADLDPDILLTDGGDSFLLPYLIHKAKELGVEFKLGREAQRLSVRKGKSYFTYGKIVHKPGQYMLRGRVHLDRGHFAYREARLYGPVELSRLAKIPMQEMSRLTPGTAFSAMQINEALRQGVLVLWKKNLPEIFKTAEELVLADRGGFIFEPEVGIHEGIYEIDFSSLYPSIMVTRNISYETLNCSCCTVDGRPVPKLSHYTCVRHKGVVPVILEPLIARRRFYKHHRQKSEEDPNYQRDSVLKWTLVTCLDGSTVVPYKLNGTYRIDRIGEIIDRYGDGKGGSVEPIDELHVFGPDRDWKLVEKRVAKVIKAFAPSNILRIRTSGGREILATTNHRFFVLTNNGTLVERQAGELCVGDFIPEYTSIPLKDGAQETINVIEPLHSSLSKEELPCWRIKGDGIAQAVVDNFPSIYGKAMDQGYSVRTPWVWRQEGMIPLQFLHDLHLTHNRHKSWSIGRGARKGGEFFFVPAEIPMDEELAFFLGFYAGDGSISGKMIRFAVGMDEPEIIGKLMNCAYNKFGLIGRFRKEKHANMLALQFNSVSLIRIMAEVFHIGPTSDNGKLVIPPLILNGSKEIRYAFLSGLLASDGCVSSSRDWAFIASSKREFVEAISLLLLSLGIRHYFRSMRPNNFPLYTVDFACRDIRNKLWLKDTHRKRLESWAYSNRNNYPRLPAVESGFSSLCRAFGIVNGIPQHRNRCISIEEVKEKLLRILASCGERPPPIAENLLRLVSANISFRRIEEISIIPHKSKYVYCFETEDEPHGFIISGGQLCGNSFGYQAYKNHRYGRIECHEAINAFAREILLRSMEIAETHGYEVVHGIVDSLWLRAKADAEPLERVVQHISDTAGIPLDVEGRYKWIVFLPCKTTGVGALNRYYGLFETGELKLRGIELRKHDTAPFINAMEEAMLGVFSEANNAAEFREKIPRALDIVRATLWKLQKGEIPVEAGVLTKVITKPLEEYLVLTTSVAALRQMRDRNFNVEPGEYIRFIITKESSRDYRLKVRVAEFLDGKEKLDAEAYTKLVCRAAETLLAPFGYTEAKLIETCSPLR
jgi:DNA polymerase elongation subunit (family B)